WKRRLHSTPSLRHRSGSKTRVKTKNVARARAAGACQSPDGGSCPRGLSCLLDESLESPDLLLQVGQFARELRQGERVDTLEGFEITFQSGRLLEELGRLRRLLRRQRPAAFHGGQIRRHAIRLSQQGVLRRQDGVLRRQRGVLRR